MIKVIIAMQALHLAISVTLDNIAQLNHQPAVPVQLAHSAWLALALVQIAMWDPIAQILLANVYDAHKANTAKFVPHNVIIVPRVHFQVTQ